MAGPPLPHPSHPTWRHRARRGAISSPSFASTTTTTTTSSSFHLSPLHFDLEKSNFPIKKTKTFCLSLHRLFLFLYTQIGSWIQKEKGKDWDRSRSGSGTMEGGGVGGAIDGLIQRLLESKNKGGSKKVQLSETEIRSLCSAAKEIFLAQPVLLELEAPINICGTN